MSRPRGAAVVVGGLLAVSGCEAADHGGPGTYVATEQRVTFTVQIPAPRRAPDVLAFRREARISAREDRLARLVVDNTHGDRVVRLDRIGRSLLLAFVDTSGETLAPRAHYRGTRRLGSRARARPGERTATIYRLGRLDVERIANVFLGFDVPGRSERSLLLEER